MLPARQSRSTVLCRFEQAGWVDAPHAIPKIKSVAGGSFRIPVQDVLSNISCLPVMGSLPAHFVLASWVVQWTLSFKGSKANDMVHGALPIILRNGARTQTIQLNRQRSYSKQSADRRP